MCLYLPPHFAQTDPESLVQCLREHPLATLVSVDADGPVVPTWNHVAAHVRGELVLHDDPASALSQMSLLTDVHQADQAQPWRPDEAPPSPR